MKFNQKRVLKITSLLEECLTAQFYNGVLAKNAPREHEYLQSFSHSENIPFIGSLWVHLKNSGTRPRCSHPNCNSTTSFKSYTSGFAMFCSSTCKRLFEAGDKYPRTPKPQLSTRTKNSILKESSIEGHSGTTFMRWLDLNHLDVASYCHYTSRLPGGSCVSKILYDLLHEDTFPKMCEHCFKNPTPFISLTRGYKKFCSNSCMGSSSEIRNKKIETNLYNNGVEFPQQSKKIRTKLKKANLKKYGYSNVGQVPEFKRNRCATMLKRWGAANAMGNMQLREKAFNNAQENRFNHKPYLLGSQQVLLQGYEPQALDWLLANTNLKPKHIEVANKGCVPTIYYRLNGVDKVYFPDIFIPKLNRIVEVKSTWTFFSTKYKFLQMRRKREACIEAGYSFILLLMASSGKRLKLPSDWYGLSFRDIVKYSDRS